MWVMEKVGNVCLMCWWVSLICYSERECDYCSFLLCLSAPCWVSNLVWSLASVCALERERGALDAQLDSHCWQERQTQRHRDREEAEIKQESGHSAPADTGTHSNSIKWSIMMNCSILACSHQPGTSGQSQSRGMTFGLENSDSGGHVIESSCNQVIICNQEAF